MLLLDSGEFRFRVERLPEFVLDSVKLMYGDQPAPAPERALPADFRISLRCDSLLRRIVRPQLSFYSDQHAPFKPVPRLQGFPILEWGMNWCVAAHDYTRLLVHAAVVEKDGKALIFPAVPGAGKSTLAAYLSLNGWNLYSDEMAVLDCANGTVSPLFRPVCLKNESIDLIRQWSPDAVITERAKDTHKGDVAHFKAMRWSNFTLLKPVPVVGILFSRYRGGANFLARQTSQLSAFRQLCSHAFNYHILGASGFTAIARLVQTSQQYSVVYDDLGELAYFLGGLLDGELNA